MTRMPAAALLSAGVLATVGHALQPEPFAPGIARIGPGISTPEPIFRQEPEYTEEARRARIEGEVWLDAVIGVNGTIGETRVTRSLDRTFGLDQAAIDAAKRWRFKPAIRAGQVIPVVVTLVMEYRLGPAPRPQPADPLRPWPDGIVYPAAPANTAEFMKDALDSSTDGVVAPVVSLRATAVYSSAALRDKVQGDVTVEAIVEPTGAVSRVRLKQTLHPDLDRNALQAALNYRFEPGKLNGRPARMMTPITIEFRIR